MVDIFRILLNTNNDKLVYDLIDKFFIKLDNISDLEYIYNIHTIPNTINKFNIKDFMDYIIKINQDLFVKDNLISNETKLFTDNFDKLFCNFDNTFENVYLEYITNKPYKIDNYEEIIDSINEVSKYIDNININIKAEELKELRIKTVREDYKNYQYTINIMINLLIYNAKLKLIIKIIKTKDLIDAINKIIKILIDNYRKMKNKYNIFSYNYYNYIKDKIYYRLIDSINKEDFETPILIDIDEINEMLRTGEIEIEKLKN